MPSVSKLQFAHVEFRGAERQLLVDGCPVALGSRAFDVLEALIEGRGRTLAKSELIERVWAGLVVEENNLQVQISALRKILGAGAIATIPGRGYRFTLAPGAGAQPVGKNDALDAPPPAASPTNLPAQRGALYGRDADLRAVLDAVKRHALVTIVGAGGMGKTLLAQSVAAGLVEHYPHGVWWIELAALADGASVPAALAGPLGIRLDGLAAIDSLVVALAARHALLVLDNCEHLIESVAALVARLLARAPQLALLVTSQEPLRIAGEQVHRLDGLAVPRDAATSDALSFGAVELFVQRARALDAGFEATAAQLPAIVEICRRLDGIPLAIEFAAARLPLLGLEGLRQRLDERFKVLTAGSRMVLRRHQTLRAALEWSYRLLSAEEQAVLRRLGVFAGSFTLASAQATAGGAEIDEWAVLEHLGALVDKSLVLAQGEGTPRYRLLETTRAYALEQLAQAGETEATLHRHAQSLIALLRNYGRAGQRWRHGRADRAALLAEVDNLRAAIAFAIDNPRPGDLAIELAALGSTVWTVASLNVEGIERLAQLQSRIDAATPPAVEARFRLSQAELGIVTGRRDCFDAAGRAIELFRSLGDAENLYDALGARAAIGAELGDAAAASAAIAEAQRIERADFAPRHRASMAWARSRWLRLEGRIDEARAATLAQAALYREDGFELGEAIALGANVAAFDVALGRLAEAEARARSAIATLTRLGAGAHAGHVHDALMRSLALQGRAHEAIEQGRIALPLLRAEADESRLLPALALAVALDGRLDDAACLVGCIEAALARGEISTRRFDASARAPIDALLGAGPAPERRAQLTVQGMAMSLAQAFELAFAGAPAGVDPPPTAPPRSR